MARSLTETFARPKRQLDHTHATSKATLRTEAALKPMSPDHREKIPKTVGMTECGEAAFDKEKPQPSRVKAVRASKGTRPATHTP